MIKAAKAAVQATASQATTSTATAAYADSERYLPVQERLRRRQERIYSALSR